MKTIRVKATFLEPVLGTVAGDPEIYEQFIASKRPDGVDPEEIEAIPTLEEDLEKGATVFARINETGTPMLWDYQIRGFFKEAFKSMIDITGSCIDTKEKQKKYRLTNYTCKKTVDNHIGVTPRRVELHLPEGGELTFCQRPLRAETMRGERIALAYSEEAPAGSWVEFTITLMDDKLEEPVLQALMYGAHKGFGQWRNSGKGRFEVEILDEEKTSPDWLNTSKIKRKTD
ncbi:MAG: hypothetical protein GF411_19940 [Candidatus Lokiarchaeota archaeon]|nr:hypothetical protein [Candidatus Lokiarchaeota archaeon]